MIGLALFGVLSYAGPRIDLVLVTCSASCSVRSSRPPSARSSTSSSPLRPRLGGGLVPRLGRPRCRRRSRHLGAIADIGNRFALAADFTFLPAMLVTALLWTLPETKGRELEDPLGRLNWRRLLQWRREARAAGELFAALVTEAPRRRTALHGPVTRTTDDRGLLVDAEAP